MKQSGKALFMLGEESVNYSMAGREGRVERLSLDYAVPDGVADQSSGFVDFKLLHDPGAVGFGSLNAYTQQRGDLLRGLALRNQLKNLQFARAQRLGSDIGLVKERVDNCLRNAGAEINQAFSYIPDCLNKLSGCPAFQHVTPDSGSQGLQNILLLGMHSQ